MIQRIFNYLLDHPEGAFPEDIARAVLHLSGASREKCEGLLRKIPGREALIDVDDEGRWHARVAQPRPSPDLEEARIAIVAARILSTHPPLIGAAGVAPFQGGREAGEPRMAFRYDPDDDEGGSGIDSEGYYQDLAGVLDEMAAADLVVVGDQRSFWRLLQADAVHAGRMSLPVPASLTEIGKRLFKSMGRPSLEALAARLELPCNTHGDLEAELGTAADLFHALLPRLREEEARTVDDLREILKSRKKPVDFRKFRFDRPDLMRLPETPGVYIMRDGEGRTLYVGKAKNLRQRVGSYFLDAEGRPRKETRLLKSLEDLEIHPAGSELEALLLEHRFIRDETPEINKQIKVHPRARKKPVEPQFILVLPSVQAGAAELFLHREGFSLRQIRMKADIRPGDAVWKVFRELFYESKSPENPLSLEMNPQEQDILIAWYRKNRDHLNVIDVARAGPFANLKRLVMEYVRQVGESGHEKTVRI